MSQDRTIGDSAASPAKSKAPTAGAYRMDAGNIPQEIRSSVADRLGTEAEVFPAKENGSYKGPVIHADKGFVVQAVGKNQQTAVVHQRADVEMMGASLKGRDANNDLVNRNIQVHYRGEHAKAYPWDAEKEQQQRAARTVEKQTERGAATATRVMSEAEKYAAENIKNAKQREAFLRHLGNVTQQAFQPQQRQEQGAKEQARPVPTQSKQADQGIER
ncbi:TPA: hypothetical protein NI803_004603 [Pseudomonas aeruginosa]|uniref:KfrB domain-containing protein n=1 Tax=Pseudomonas aeruginosa TaxID=287 RepID=UPI000E330811|nr:hypothetical protein [Pseudomonas aeruginosa]SYY08080.1 Uncharacterised protein [Acinetobacter baumannii]MDP2556114.1 hypothetical protein [Pseudomonas aeruginosa]HBN8448260.1 hypothetical protein [Pseudomonas aeruginosa]HBP5913451.1 hypothetical protein [Pseudomonas aeruginosa]HCF9833311.1 hypothetical protein [Pseudomonas aeruginosa]